MTLATKIYSLRKARGLTMKEMGAIAGVSDTAVFKWELGEVFPKAPRIRRICTYFGLNFSLFYDETNDYYDNDLPREVVGLPPMRSVPLLGDIACGDPINPDASSAESVQMPDFVHADYALRCKGDSMINARIYDGDLVYIRSQPEVENGEIAAVVVDGEITLKRVYKRTGFVILQPENPAHEPIIVTTADISAGKMRIIGKAVAFTSRII